MDLVKHGAQSRPCPRDDHTTFAHTCVETAKARRGVILDRLVAKVVRWVNGILQNQEMVARDRGK